jgi:hypothetical protein
VSDGRKDVFVGMGVTCCWSEVCVFAGTVTRLSDDGRAFWFKQDRVVKRKRGIGPAYLFVEDTHPLAREYEARLEGGQFFVPRRKCPEPRRPLELGVRRDYVGPPGERHA